MATAEERLMEWLRDAHAAEKQAETMLSGMASRIEHYPDLKERVRMHLTETQNQARSLEECIKRRGGSVSLVKDTGGRLAGLGQALNGMFVGDEVMKGSIASYAFEAMEIASYQILISAAELVGDHQTAAACRKILAEEKAMAGWLENNIGALTEAYLAREKTPGVAASR